MELSEPVGIQVQADLENKNRWSNLPKKKKILIISISLVFVLLCILILIPKNNREQNQSNGLIVTPPIAIITVTPVLAKSHWSSESAVLKIENDNRNLTNDLINIDLVEPALSLPNIEVNVNFQK